MSARGDTLKSFWFETSVGRAKGERKVQRSEESSKERRMRGMSGRRKDGCREGRRKGSASSSPPLKRDTWCGFDRAGEAGRKVEKTVSTTPGTHRRIICWGWVNCDLRSVMTCNNFLSLLSVTRRVRSPQQGEGCRGRKTGSRAQSKQMRGDILCNVGSGHYNQINYRDIKAVVNAAGEYRCWS